MITRICAWCKPRHVIGYEVSAENHDTHGMCEKAERVVIEKEFGERGMKRRPSEKRYVEVKFSDGRMICGSYPYLIALARFEAAANFNNLKSRRIEERP